MNFVKIDSTLVDNLTRRVVKFLRLGLRDVQTSLQAGPYGSDTNPIANMVAVYAPTDERGKTVILGYINKNQLAQPGEHRIFSTNEDGELQTYLWLKNDGNMAIGGDADNMVRFSELKTGFDQLKTDLNDLIQKYNSHTHLLTIVPTVGTATGTAAPTITQDTPSNADIDGAKIDEIKTL